MSSAAEKFRDDRNSLSVGREQRRTVTRNEAGQTQDLFLEVVTSLSHSHSLSAKRIARGVPFLGQLRPHLLPHLDPLLPTTITADSCRSHHHAKGVATHGHGQAPGRAKG